MITKALNKLKFFSFPFILYGYGLVAIFVTDSSISYTFSAPYRVVVLLICFILITPIFLQQVNNGSVKINSRHKSNNKPAKRIPKKSLKLLLLIKVFIFIYSLRLVHDVFIIKLVYGDYFYYLSFWFFISLIPCSIFLNIDWKKPSKYLSYTKIFLNFFLLLLFFQFSILMTSNFSLGAGRLGGEAINPITLGIYCGSVILVSAYTILFNTWRQKNIFNLILNIVTILIGFFFLISTASRGPIISTILCLAILFFSSGKKAIYIGIPTLICSTIPIFYYIVPLLEKKGDFALNRYSQFNDSLRSTLLELSFKKIIETPFGFLFGSTLELPNHGYPHNLVIESFLSTGVIGGLLFSLICLVSIKRSLALLFSHHPWSWVGILFIQSFMLSLASGSLYGSSTFWYLLIATNYVWSKVWRIRKSDFQVIFS